MIEPLTIFGIVAVLATITLLVLQGRGPWYRAAFAVSCALSSVYQCLQGHWFFASGWAIIALVSICRVMWPKANGNEPGQACTRS
jgi:hypothetical protein